MPKPKKHALFPLGYDEVSLVDEGAAGSAHVLIMKRKKPTAPKGSKKSQTMTTKKPQTMVAGDGKSDKSKGRSQSNPCAPGKSSTGAKTGDSSTRAKNWKEGRHKRKEDGKFSQSSSESKEKYGKGGTTKSKMDRACRNRRKGKKDSSIVKSKSAMSSWDSTTQVLNVLEREATR